MVQRKSVPNGIHAGTLCEQMLLDKILRILRRIASERKAIMAVHNEMMPMCLMLTICETDKHVIQPIERLSLCGGRIRFQNKGLIAGRVEQRLKG